jgi:hypothetical protein
MAEPDVARVARLAVEAARAGHPLIVGHHEFSNIRRIGSDEVLSRELDAEIARLAGPDLVELFGREVKVIILGRS